MDTTAPSADPIHFRHNNQWTFSYLFLYGLLALSSTRLKAPGEQDLSVRLTFMSLETSIAPAHENERRGHLPQEASKTNMFSKSHSWHVQIVGRKW